MSFVIYYQQGAIGNYVVYIDNDYETTNPAGYYLLPASANEDDYHALDSAPTAPAAAYATLSSDSTVLSYGLAISDYLADNSMFDGNLAETDFANEGILDIEQ